MGSKSQPKLEPIDERSVLLSKEEAPQGPVAAEDLPYFGARHTLACVSFLGFFCLYAMRVNLSVALVAMVNSTHTEVAHTKSECKDPYANMTEVHRGEFTWDGRTQGHILGAFFYGYVVTQLPGGWLAARYGGKLVFGAGALCTSVLTLLTPLAARMDPYLLIAVRAVEGLGEGVTFGAMDTMWGKWAPVYERTILLAFTYSGCSLGTVLSLMITGILSDSDFLGGWPSAFYIFGASGVAWFFLWLFLVYDTPSAHPRIKMIEREYIESSIQIHTDQEAKMPWKEIATSPAVWGLCISSFTNNWGVYVFLTSLPTYLKNVLHYRVSENGSLSALPYTLLWVVSIVVGVVADWVRRKNWLSTKNTRKVFNTIGTLIPAVLVLCVGYVGCNHVLILLLLTLCVGIGGFSVAGCNVNHIDIAPKYAGILIGLSKTFGTIPGFVSPVFVGLMTQHNQTAGRWQIVFYVTAGIYLFGMIVFNLLAQGEVQSWGGAAPTSSRSLNQFWKSPGEPSPPPAKPRKNSYGASVTAL